jgi:predicted O-methyltransferase YrrM
MNYTVSDFLNDNGIYMIEGFTQHPKHIDDLIGFVKNKNIKTVVEIGFNAGHSAEIFLKHNPDTNVISFDIGLHKYIPIAKQYIDRVYPNRHLLIIGDSTIQIPEFISKNNITADIIFIDGGHTYEVSKLDLENCVSFADSNTIVIMDDTMITNQWIKHWNVGPSCVWYEKKKEGKIMELGHCDYGIGEGMSWGKYLFS